MMLNFTALSTHGKSKIEPPEPSRIQTHSYVEELAAEENTVGGGGAHVQQTKAVQDEYYVSKFEP